MAKQRLEEIRKIRLEKVKKLRKLGIDPYPSKVDGSPKPVSDALENLGKPAEVAGRIVGWRAHGNVIFADLKDETGTIQLWFQKNSLKENYEILKYLDVGDFLYAKGKVTKTQSGEISVNVEKFQLLTKTIRPLPSTWHGLKDVELRHRKRYLDLLMNDGVRDTFVIRSNVLHALRDYLHSKGFLETEVPILQPIAGGANAKPFVTYLEALHQKFFLRIAPELYLKRLLVGGYEKVYEMGKNFRNEGFSLKHNPEYTLLEVYQAYADYNYIMKFAEDLLNFVAESVLGKNSFKFSGQTISLKTPWPRLQMRDVILEKTGVDIDQVDKDALKKYLIKEKIETEKSDDKGRLIDKLFSAKVEKDLIQPTFIINLPIDISPLAKKVKDKPNYVQRFELYMGGMEIANAYSELNDPVDQKERFLEQARKKKVGVEETHPIDEDFVEALEYGMPPAGGIGFGVDRIVLVLADLPNLRETLLFPTLKQEDGKKKLKKRSKK